MAFPTIGQPNWGPDLLDTLGVELNTDGTLKNVVRPTDLPPGAAYQAFDIWDGFDSTGAAPGSWNASTYSGWISGLDSLLATEISGGEVVKTDLGVSSDASTHVFSYAAGTGPVNVLIVSGQHGNEVIGMWSTMRWFEQFATADTMVMRQLRNAFRVTWIPALNPSRYKSSRVNDNEVDTNRNFDYYWERYVPFSEEYEKGDAPFDQPETQIVQDLMDTTDFRVVLDCHNYTSEGDTMAFSVPGHWMLGARQFGVDAVAAWERLYGDGITSWQWYSPVQNDPSLVNWANYHIRHLNGHDDAATFLIEASGNVLGSTPGTAVSQAGARAYAGMIQAYLEQYLLNVGRTVDPPYPYTMYGYRSDQQAAVLIENGGTLVSTATDQYLTFRRYVMNGARTNGTSYEIPLLVAPALLTVQMNGTMRSLGNAIGRHEIKIHIDGTNNPDERTTVTVPATATHTQSFAIAASRIYDEVSNETVPTVRVSLRRINGGDAELLGMNLVCTVTPHTFGQMIPRIDGA